MKTIGNSKNYNAIDIAKFICSILVVMIHIAPFGVQENTTVFSYLNFILQHGICRIAVPLFFMFSGLFLYQKTPLNNFSMNPTKKYIINILKLYLIWAIIYFPLSLDGILKSENGIMLYIRDIFLTGAYMHLWYLTALIFAVYLISFLLFAKWSPKKILITSSICYIIGLFGSGYWGFITPLYSIPIIGKLIGMYFYIFSVTRNGLFFAFFFVALGMFLSEKKDLLSTKKSLIWFIISTVLMCAETVLLKTFNIAKTYDILIFAIPSALFCFIFLTSVKLKDRPVYKKLRELSSLIYYSHMIISFLIAKYVFTGTINIKNNSILFLTTLALTISISLLVLKISKTKIKFLKNIY